MHTYALAYYLPYCRILELYNKDKLMQYASDIGNVRRQAANYAFQDLILNRYCCRSPGELLLSNKQLHDDTIASGDLNFGSCYVLATERGYLDPPPLPVGPLRAKLRVF